MPSQGRGAVPKDLSNPLKVGITFDTRDDFSFVSEEVEDWDAEFAVSTAVQDIAHALKNLGHEVQLIGSGRNLLNNLRKVEDSVDIIFNIAEGYFGRGREAQIPAILELVGIPYVGSDSYTLALALNKWHTKVLAASSGVRTPEFCLVREPGDLRRWNAGYPAIAKLCYEGSSKGLRPDSLAQNERELERAAEYLLRYYKQPVIVEKFIEGRELDVPIIGTYPSRAFGVVGITLDGGMHLGRNFLTSEIVKGDAYGFCYPLNEPFVAEAEQSSLSVYRLLDCRDFGRVDMRVDEEGYAYFLEINPYPFLGRHSSFSEIATKTHLGYKGMIKLILDGALRRQEVRNTSILAGGRIPNLFLSES
jgi:D-alanine-D-alanine ligase